MVKLRNLAAASIAEHPDRTDAQCAIPHPVNLEKTQGPKSVAFTSGLTLDCRFAVSLSRFVSDTVQPLAEFHMGERLKKLYSGEGYVCRRRNNAATGKLSEHSFGNAIDLVGFEFASGKRLDIRAASAMRDREAKFFRALRQAACGAFTTVLGPGSNTAHATHLHLDLGRSKGRKNPYRICE